MYFSIWEASTLIDLFFVKGKMRALSMCGKKLLEMLILIRDNGLPFPQYRESAICRVSDAL